MGRPTDLTPRDIDFYYRHRIEDCWASVHACRRVHEEGEERFEAVCGLVSRKVSTISAEEIYDSVDEALRSTTNPCALCRGTGAFDSDS